jgi:hypothetical protein
MANVPDRTDGPGDPSGLRAADSDRERVAEVLRQAAGDGRLTLDELDERLGRAYAAKTYAELEPITSDLPQAAADPRGSPAATMAWASGRTGGKPTSRFGIAIMGGFRRRGHWVAPRHFTALALMGGGEIDLRDAAFAEGELTIRALALMGGIHIIVPDGAELHVHAIGIMGGVDEPGATPVQPGAPRITVVGLALMGGIEIKHKPHRGSAERGELRHGDGAEWREQLDRGRAERRELLDRHRADRRERHLRDRAERRNRHIH